MATMLLNEVIQLVKPNEFDKKGTEMKIPNVYKKHEHGQVTPQTVIVKNSATGKVYGRRTVYQKTTSQKEK